MSIDFKIHGLNQNLYSRYFDLPQAELESISAYQFKADESPCYPCRVSLADAQIGETVLAINHEHLSARSPYKSSGPIFIRKNAESVQLEINQVPVMLRHRLLSVRAYNDKSLMIEADTTMGNKLESILHRQFHNESVTLIQIHNAGPGCFNCSVVQAPLNQRT